MAESTPVEKDTVRYWLEKLDKKIRAARRHKQAAVNFNTKEMRQHLSATQVSEVWDACQASGFSIGHAPDKQITIIGLTPEEKKA